MSRAFSLLLLAKLNFLFIFSWFFWLTTRCANSSKFGRHLSHFQLYKGLWWKEKSSMYSASPSHGPSLMVLTTHFYSRLFLKMLKCKRMRNSKTSRCHEFWLSGMSIESPFFNIKCMEIPKIAQMGSFGNFLIPALMKCYMQYVEHQVIPKLIHSWEETSEQGSFKNSLENTLVVPTIDINFGQITN